MEKNTKDLEVVLCEIVSNNTEDIEKLQKHCMILYACVVVLGIGFVLALLF